MQKETDIMQMISYASHVSATSAVSTVDLFDAIKAIVSHIRTHKSTVEVEFDAKFLQIISPDDQSPDDFNGFSIKNDGSYEFSAIWRFVAELMGWMQYKKGRDKNSFIAECGAIKTQFIKLSLYAAFEFQRLRESQFIKNKKVTDIYNYLHSTAVKQGLIGRRKLASIPPETAVVDGAWDGIFQEHRNAVAAATHDAEGELASAMEAEWAALFSSAEQAEKEHPPTNEGDLDLNWDIDVKPPAPPSVPPFTGDVDAEWDVPTSLETPKAKSTVPPASTDDIDNSWDDRPSFAA